MKQFCSFSEAIREGAKLKPQVRVAYYSREGTCAIGAGLHAMFTEDATADHLYHFEVEAVSEFPYLSESVKCPVHRWWNLASICRSARRSRIRMISHLNDYHEWTRERIADWLESEEEKLGYVTLVESAPNALSLEVETVESRESFAGLTR
jgi:hypothetical protein